MGNIQQSLEKMDSNTKLEFLVKEGLLNDEMIQLYRQGIIDINDIHNYLFNNHFKNMQNVYINICFYSLIVSNKY